MLESDEFLLWNPIVMEIWRCENTYFSPKCSTTWDDASPTHIASVIFKIHHATHAAAHTHDIHAVVIEIGDACGEPECEPAAAHVRGSTKRRDSLKPQAMP